MAQLALAQHVNRIADLFDSVAELCSQFSSVFQMGEDVKRLQDQVKSVKNTFGEVQKVLDGPKSASISASWDAIEAIGKCSTQLGHLKAKLISTLESMSSSAQWPSSSEDLDERIKVLSACNQTLSSALQPKQTSNHQLNDENSSNHELNDDNLINRLNSASSFRHDPLNQDREIRLIRFSISDTSDSKSNSDRIIITLENAPLDSNQKYQSLSYTWGNSNDPENIRKVAINKRDFFTTANLGTADFFITANLDTALRNLHPQFKGEDVLLWVDAVCINQLKVSERNSQVQLMREIYEQATLVLIWLGPAFENSHRTMEAIKKLGKRGITLRLDQKCLSFEEDIVISDSDSASLPVSATVMLTEREWWKRVWVLQELAVAHRADFICGSNRVSLDHFMAAIRYLTSYLHDRMKRLDASNQNEQVKHLNNLSYLINFKLTRTKFFFYVRGELEKRNLFLEDLLVRTCGFLRSEPMMEATKPLDRVYALWGMLSKEEKLEIELNYEAPCHIVYTDVAKALLSSSPKVLSFCRFPKEIKDLPSWVPDWSASNMDQGYWKWDAMLDSSKVFRTSGSSVFNWTFHSENRTLSIKGRRFDEVEKTMDDDVREPLVAKYNEHQRHYNQRGITTDPSLELEDLRNVCIAARPYLTIMKDLITGGKAYSSEDIQDDAVWKTAIADMVIGSAAQGYTRTQDAPEEVERLRLAYKTVLNGNAYEDDVTIAKRYCNHHLYRHICDEGLIPRLVNGLEDYFDNALPWEENISKLLDVYPTLFQDMKELVSGPSCPFDADTKEKVLAGLTFVLGSGKDLMETLLPILNEVLNERMKAGGNATFLSYFERFTPSIFLHVIGKRSIGRRGFCTSKGYLGLGPESLQSGDHVVIVHGSTVPFILRRCDQDKFTLIGEAYVHGIMDGEGMKDDTEPKEFVLL